MTIFVNSVTNIVIADLATKSLRHEENR